MTSMIAVMGGRHRLGAASGILAVSVVLVSACGPAATTVRTTTKADTAPAVRATSTAPATAVPPANPTAPITRPDTPVPAPGTALSALAALPVKGRAPKTGYSREQFGPAWADVDRNGCDTRNDILRRDLTATPYKPDTRDCLVLTGSLLDPYSGSTIAFTRSDTTSAAIQIDHVVALSDAWQTGAQQLDPARRTALANDPMNLLAVDGRLNTQKSDSDAASWLPPNKSFRCDYVARQVAVKSTYALWLTQAEHDAIAQVLQSCPGELLPIGSEAPVRPETTTQSSMPTPVPATTPPRAPAMTSVPSPAGAPFANCAAARAAGAAPVHRGDPGYSAKLDRDGDGIACE